jgi:hypothetical protein
VALEAAYAFDGSGTTVLDLSGNGRDMDLTGTNGVQVAGGQTGNALGKNGATMPTLPASVLSACQTDDRTIMFDAKQNLTTWWVRFDDPVFSSGMWGVLNLGNMAVQARDNTGSHNLATRPTTTAPDATNWHNYCATYVRGTGVISLYLDGALASTSSFAAGTQLSTSATVIDLAEWSTTGAALDNLRIYSHALTAGEVATVAGTPVTSAANVTGTALADLGGLTATVAGTRDVPATATATLGALTATALGTRVVDGTLLGSLGALTATAAGTRVVTGTFPGNLGALTAVVSGQRAVTGTATASLGQLVATIVIAGSLPSTRLHASGREPATHVAGREPRESI